MSTYAGDPTSFPSSVVVPDDGVAIDAADTNPPAEVALDRTAFAARRLMPSGVTTFTSNAILAPTDLTTITGAVDLETRHLPGYGLYIYRAAFSDLDHPSDGTLVVDGHGGVGKWLAWNYLQNAARLVKTDTQVLHGTGFQFGVSAQATSDPAGRNAGGGVGIRILTTGTFSLRAGDLLDISYAVPFYLFSVGNVNADPVFGAGLGATSGVGSMAYFDEGIAREAQHTGADANGVRFIFLAATSVPLRYNFARSFRHVVTLGDLVTNPESFTVGLGGACDTDNNGQILQGAMLSVSQWRLAL